MTQLSNELKLKHNMLKDLVRRFNEKVKVRFQERIYENAGSDVTKQQIESQVGTASATAYLVLDGLIHDIIDQDTAYYNRQTIKDVSYQAKAERLEIDRDELYRILKTFDKGGYTQALGERIDRVLKRLKPEYPSD